MNIQKTPTLTAAEQTLLDSFSERFSRLPGNPEIAMARDEAIDSIKRGGLPTRRVEAWHYTDLRRLLTSIPAYDSGAVARPIEPLLSGSALATVANGLALEADQSIAGLSFRPFEDLLGNGKFEKKLSLPGNEDVIDALNTAFVSGGWAIDVENDCEIVTPVEIQNLHAGGQTHVRFPVHVGKGSSITVVERQKGEGAVLATSLVDLVMQADSEVNWIVVQEQPLDATMLSRFRATLGERCRLRLFIMNAGGQLVREEVMVSVAGEGADFQLRGINLLAGSGHTDITMVLDHLVPSTTSTQIIRNVADDSASGVFQGRINVNRIAQKTDARMACNTLLLSDDASFSAKPELEIFADDVACGHGATVTEIDENHLFYLMSRGIPAADARQLLVKAFVAEIIEELENEELVSALETKLDDWFVSHG